MPVNICETLLNRAKQRDLKVRIDAGGRTAEFSNRTGIPLRRETPPHTTAPRNSILIHRAAEGGEMRNSTRLCNALFQDIRTLSATTCAGTPSDADKISRLIFRATRYWPRLSCNSLAMRRRSSSCRVSIRPLKRRVASSASFRLVMSVLISNHPFALPEASRRVVQ